ncbi:ankyrin repeat-containing domain protein [Aspergillus heterothallicus]
MMWHDLPTDVRSLILKEIATLSNVDLHRVGEPGGVFMLEDDEVEFVQRSDQPEDIEAYLGYKAIHTCLQVCKEWRELMMELLVVYGPPEVVISHGSEQLAIAAVESWLNKRKRTGNTQMGWHIGRQDLLALSIRRGFADCMILLLEQFSTEELLSYWDKHQWHAEFYPHMAVADGRTAILQMLQRYGMAIDQPDWRGRTPLAIAVRQNHAQVADYLLSVGARKDVKLPCPLEILYRLDAGENYQLTMIEWAAYRGSLDMVQVLIKHGVYSCHLPGGQWSEPLRWIPQRHDLAGMENIISLIFEHAGKNEIQRYGTRVLALALKYHASTELIRSLVSGGVPLDKLWNVDLLSLAVEFADEETIYLLIDHGATCTLDAINAAIERNREDLVDILLPCCVTCSTESIEKHVLAGNLGVIKTYLAYGAEANFDSNCVLSAAARKGNLEMCKLLIENGADVNACLEPSKGEGPLLVAILGSHVDVVAFFLECGASTKVTNDQYDPLTVAIGRHDVVLSGHDSSGIRPDASMAIIRLLVEYGADINALSFSQGSPFHEAVRLGLLDVVELLLENGAMIDLRVEGYGTPLQLAALKGLPEMIGLLLKHGANMNVTSDNYGEPLHTAIEAGSLVCVKLLLENNASLHSGKGYPSALEGVRRRWEET